MGARERELQALERMLVETTTGPVKLSYEVIKSITKEFSEDEVIGRGGFGVVYRGTLRNGTVAVKKLLSGSRNFDEEQFLKEVKCLTRAKHKNIVRFLGYCADTQGEIMEVNGRYTLVEAVRQRLLCFEYVPNGSLERYLKGNFQALDWNRRYQVIKGICQGLHYLHKQHINHLDLKPENVLLDNRMEPKITDFGLSRCFDEKQSVVVTESICGTRGYLAPEYIDSGEISSKSDIYSLGVIMKKLSMGCSMHGTENRNEALDVECLQIKKCSEIAESCIDRDKHKRPTIEQIIGKLSQIEIPVEKVIQVDESGGHQVGPYAPRELLRVEPRKLRCPLAANKRMPFSLQLTNNSPDDHVAFMFQDFGKVKSTAPRRRGVIAPQSTWGVVLHMEFTGEQAAADMVLVRSTIVSQGFNADDITMDMFNKQTCVHDIELDVVFEEQSQARPTLLREFGKLQLGANEGTSHATTQACPGSINTELLDIYPLELRFPSPAKKFCSRSINLSNTTDDGMTFWVKPSNPVRYWSSRTFCRGTVAPQSTCAIGFSILDENCREPNMEEFEILMVTSSSLAHLPLNGCPVDVAEQVFKAVKEKGGKAHRVCLFCEHGGPDPLGCITHQGIPTSNFGKMTSIDVHPTEPLILTGHQKYVCIWRTMQRQKHITEKARGFNNATEFVVKFIARRQWALSGDSSGKICVYTRKLESLHEFTAHSGQVRSLAVHPSQPYVLSSSDDCMIKLWDWDNAWTCTREFEGHMNPVTQVALNPKDTNTFGSVSCLSSDGPGNVKIWSIDSTDPKIDLYGGFKTFDWCITMEDKQYMVTIVDGGVIEIWDIQAERCVHEVKDFWNNNANVVVCHPTLPLILTGSPRGILRLWNLTTYSLEYSCAYENTGGPVIGFGFIDQAGYKRLVPGFERRIIPLEIDLQKLADQH